MNKNNSCVLFENGKPKTNIVEFTADRQDLHPRKASIGAAGYDICSKYPLTILGGETCSIDTGVSVAIPEGYYAQLSLRSSMGNLGLMMPHGVGVIDCDYRGVIKVLAYNYKKGSIHIDAGQRIAQLVFIKIPPITLNLVASLDETVRGSGGFGSTGQNDELDKDVA
jgi:dUTP pyrophosphatase